MTADQMPNFSVPEGAKKTDKEYLEEIIKDMMGGWVPVKLYCDLYGETMPKIKHRLKQGYWQRGVHYAVPPGSSAWVNLPAVRRWLEDQTKAPEGAGDESEA